MPVAGARIERSFEEVMAERFAALVEVLVGRSDLADLTVFTNGLGIAVSLETPIRASRSCSSAAPSDLSSTAWSTHSPRPMLETIRSIEVDVIVS